MMTATAAAFWLLATATGAPVMPAQIPAAAWPGLVGVGVVSTFIAIQAFYAGTKRVGAAQASLVSTIEPVWTIVLAAISVSDSRRSSSSAALIIVAVVLPRRRPPARPEPPMRLRIADE
jgi:drug/metabolite transporter (DMT)-like permease